MAGGSSHQRAVKKAEEKRITETVVQRLLTAPHFPIAEPPRKNSFKSKLHNLWGSTSTWTAIGVLIGAIVSRLSFNLLFIGVWIVVCIDVIKTGFFGGRTAKVIGNIFLIILLAVVFYTLWRISPRPKEPPTIDQQIEAFTKKFPGLTSPQSQLPPARKVETKVVYPEPRLKISVTKEKVLVLDNRQGEADLLDFEIQAIHYCLDGTAFANEHAVIARRDVVGGDLDFKHFDVKEGGEKRIDMSKEPRYALVLAQKCIALPQAEAFDSDVSYDLLRISFTAYDTGQRWVHYSVVSPYVDKFDLAQHPESAYSSKEGAGGEGFPYSINTVLKENARTYYGTEIREYQP
jgi:hypothetical protein